MRWKLLNLGLLLSLAGCGGSDVFDDLLNRDEEEPVTTQSWGFKSVAAPQSLSEQAQLYLNSEVQTHYSNDTWSTAQALSFTPLFANTDVLSARMLGGIVDSTLTALYDSSETGFSVQFLSDMPQSIGLLHAPDTPADRFYLLTYYAAVTRNNAEYSHPNVSLAWSQAAAKAGHYPMHLQLTELTQNTNNGEFTINSSSPVDVSAIGGLWQAGAGQVSPWNTFLAGEDQEPDARAWLTNSQIQGATPEPLADFLSNYFGDSTTYGNAAPYHYGYIHETEVFDNGTSETLKHYGMGRFAHAGLVVLGDQQTVYMTDRQGHGGLFMFIGSAGNLSAGTLYAARWTQTSSSGVGTADLTWIKLGSSSDLAIESLIFDQKLSFTDIFDVSSTAATGYTAVKLGTGQVEYLKLKDRMETAAAFLETRRYAAMLGASIEFSQLHSLAYDKAHNRLYLSAGEVNAGMLSETDNPQDHIQVQGDSQGAVYVLGLSSGQKDEQRKDISSSYVATTMSGLGEVNGADAYSSERVKRPQALAWSNTAKVLYIASHAYDQTHSPLYAYETDYLILTPLAYPPAAAAGGGVQILENTNGFGYLLYSYQHTGLFHPNSADTATQQSLQDYLNNRLAEVGYIALPALK